MSQSSPQQSPMSNLPMKKKIVIALVAVVVGHMGVLWGISHLKTATLVKIEKEPIKVKLVKIKEELAPPPPPPAVKPKVEPKPRPKPEPKPLPKPIPKPLPKPEPKPLPKPIEKPKVIAQKPEKTQAKAIQQDDRVEQQRLEQQRLDRLREQQQREQQQLREQQQREQQQLREQQQREQQQREQEEARKRSQQPVKAQAGDISWSIKPKPNYDDDDLKGDIRSLIIYIEADEKGNIKKDKVRIVKSSGLPSLDAKFIAAVKRAKFKPYISNGVAAPVYVEQPFDLKPSKAKK